MYIYIYPNTSSWATRSGRINFDQIIETIYSDEVTVTSDILIGVGNFLLYFLDFFCGETDVLVLTRDPYLHAQETYMLKT